MPRSRKAILICIDRNKHLATSITYKYIIGKFQYEITFPRVEEFKLT